MDERERLMRAGLEAFDAGRFFEAHEHWEDVWRVVSGPERTWIQGLIQLAAALVKMDLDSFLPCGRLAARAAEKLADAPPELDGIDLARARAVLAVVSAAAVGARRLELSEIRLR